MQMEDNKICIPTFQELSFDETTHTYRLFGDIVPSVTQLMKPLSEKKYGNVYSKTLQQAANKGTIVHEGVENWVKYGIDDVPDEYIGYFNAFKAWWQHWKPDLVASEVRVYHKLMLYAGTIDLLVMLDGKLTLVDIKTTYKLEDKLCRTQLEAYLQALESHGIHVQRKKILLLRKDGTYSDPDFELRDKERLDAFIAYKRVYDDVNN